MKWLQRAQVGHWSLSHVEVQHVRSPTFMDSWTDLIDFHDQVLRTMSPKWYKHRSAQDDPHLVVYTNHQTPTRLTCIGLPEPCCIEGLTLSVRSRSVRANNIERALHHVHRSDSCRGHCSPASCRDRSSCSCVSSASATA
jgi:hypothetical protein